MGDWIWKIIFAGCTIGCFAGCFCYGRWIVRQEKAVGFWANKPFDAGRVKDVSDYNREYGKIFQIFSYAPGLAGISMLLSLEILSIVILVLWATVGILWFIRAYQRIEKNYIF